MAWILNDRGIHDAAEQEAAGEIGQIVADEDGLVRPSAVGNGLGNALRTGTLRLSFCRFYDPSTSEISDQTSGNKNP